MIELRYSLSVCITTYESYETLNRTVKGLLGTYSNIEFCIVDNFSKDGTFEGLKSLENNNIKVRKVRSTRGKGRNVAVKMAKNSIILVLDADVYIKNLNKYLEKYISDYYGKVLFLRGDNKGAWAMVITKKLFMNLGGFPDLNWFEDSYFFKLSERLDLLIELKLYNTDVHSMPVDGMISGNERRYSHSIFILLKRNILRTRDHIVIDPRYRKFINDKSKNNESLLINTALYIFAYPLARFKKIDSIDRRVEIVKRRI